MKELYTRFVDYGSMRDKESDRAKSQLNKCSQLMRSASYYGEKELTAMSDIQY